MSGGAGDAYARAWRLAQVGRYAEAERLARAGLAGAPADGRLSTLLASVRRLRHDYGAALAAADAAVAAEPGLADAHAERAECLLALVRAPEAVAAAEQAVRLAPSRAAGHLVLARALVAARDTGRARAVAAHGLSLDPASVPALLTVADVERVAGDREAATVAARAALAREPSSAYGRWLMAMLDAERLRVRRSMRGLREVAREDPGRPDLLSMTWPVRGVLDGLRRGVAVGAGLVVVVLLLARWWPAVGSLAQPFARMLAGVLAAVLAGFAARVLIPAGRLPWRCLRLLPPAPRRAVRAGLVTAVAAVGSLVAFAATGWWPFALLALLAAPALWACHLRESRGDQPL
jgi:tetratricopeptide (TPR) repeat protein